MTIYDQKRLRQATLKLDIDGIRNGYYSDKYFANIATILTALRETNYTFIGNSPRDLPFDPTGMPIGDIVVEAQIFNRRAPYTVVAGVDAALTMIRHCAGHFEGDSYYEAWRDLEVVAVDDGVITNYGGDPNDVETVIEIRGRYSDFTLLETPILGVLTRASRIATNVYDVLQAANGKQVLFFPARFDLPQTQSIDGYAYWVAVQRYNHEFNRQIAPLVSTDAQAAWWGGHGGGTVPHAIIACFFADTTETMLAFARHIPTDVPRIALVDFNNDTVNASLATLTAFWREYSAAMKAGDVDAQKRWTLNGVRLDTSGNMLDKSLTDETDKGVSAALVHTVRRALDNAWTSWDVPSNLEDEAKAYCRNVQIVVSGGFNADKIARFERDGVPADVYGVGSTFLNNSGSTNTDFTMDVVRLYVNDEWVDMAKVGRRPCDNRDLHPVDLSEF